MDDLSRLTLTQLLVRAELDDRSNKNSYYEEIKGRNYTKEEFKEAYNTLEFIRESRQGRRQKPLSIFYKIVLIIAPFLILNRSTADSINNKIQSWKSNDYKRKTREFYIFSSVGFSLYIILFVGYSIIKASNLDDKYYSKGHPLGHTLNERRQSLNIPTIPTGWFTKNGEKWSDFKTQDKPYHKEKIVSEAKEIDRFINPISQKENQFLEITFSYTSAEYNESPWTCYLIHEKEGEKYLYESITLSRQQADSVLRKWGL